MMARRGRPGRGSEQGLLTILFTDIEGSTALTQRLGDQGAQEIVRAHNSIVRREIAARGGSEVKHTGDGIMATFPSASRASGCAVAIQHAVQSHGDEHPERAFDVRIGLNAGEPVAEDADVFGAAVQLAARTCAEAKGGQILATNVVRELVFGKGYLFADVGAPQLKGFDEPIHLYEITRAAGVPDDQSEGASLTTVLRRPVVLVAVGVAALATVGGVVAAVIISSGGTGGESEVAYRSFRYHVEAEGPVEVTGGDCVNTDTIISGTLPATLSGELSGTGEVIFEGRLPAADGCSTLRSTIDSRSVVAGGTFTEHTLAISLSRLGAAPTMGSATDAISAGIVVGESGVYDGSVGKNTCRSRGLSRSSSEGLIATASNDCTIKFAESARDVPIILQAVGSPTEIAPQLSAAGGTDTARVVAVFRNNSESPLNGVTLRLPQPVASDIASRLAADEEWIDGERVWPLGDLDAGETATFEFTVRLISATQDTLTLVPEITAEGLDFIDRSDPIVLTVVG